MRPLAVIHARLSIIFGVLFLLCSPVSAAEDANWSVAIKAGYFSPEVDDWKENFGSNGDDLWGLQVGYKITRWLEFGLEGGYFSAQGKARTVSGVQTSVKQEFRITPLQAYLSLRLDFLEDQVLVPFAGGGYSHYTYSQKVEGGDETKGGLDGYHFRGGVLLLLDRIDPESADDAFREWGIDDTYLLIEAQFSAVDDFGDSDIDIGGLGVIGALVVDF